MILKRLITILMIVTLALGTLGCSKEKEKLTKENVDHMPVEVTEVKPSVIKNQFFSVSSLEAKEAILAQSSIEGTVKNVFVKVGEGVEKGKPLFEVDGEDLKEKLELNIKQAATELQQTKVTYENVERRFNNTKRLYSEGAVSRTEYDGSEEELKKAKLDLQLAEKNYSTSLVSSKTNLKKLIINSPIKGTIAYVNVKKGELLGDESGIKIIIEDRIIAKISVTEDMIDKINTETLGKIYVPSIDKSFNSKIIKINREIDSVSLTYPVTLEITDEIQTVRAGMYAEVTLDIEEIEGQILVAQKAVILEGERAYVYKLIGDEKVEKVFVEKGVEVDGNVQITGDIRFGERIITKGQYFINEESKIQVVENRN
ncbi:efflux RND transporter periplasmic adaptor subunit [Wukongibacter sp. M2B1]|uniref:efflux RND transporter periplasmic adaptor subunit n=1 Tax=Wukongibacter sp. M2B1 TaxID=3088895 RepID=UPI003D7BEC3B